MPNFLKIIIKKAISKKVIDFLVSYKFHFKTLLIFFFGKRLFLLRQNLHIDKIYLNQKFYNKNINFLHIGKCGGTNLKNIFTEISNNTEHKIICHKHFIKLNNLVRKKYIFSIRHPFERFNSAFYYRKNKGFPTHNVDYSSQESICFGRFDHANDLAEQLYSKKLIDCYYANFSMHSVIHICEHLVTWFTIKQLIKNPPFFIFSLDDLENDLVNFSKKLKIKRYKLSTDEKIGNIQKYKKTFMLSEKSKYNLSKFYSEDLKLYNYIMKMKNTYNSI